MPEAPAARVWYRESNQNNDEEVAAQSRFRDPETGVQKIRLTSRPCIHSHIYPEAPVSSPDGRLVVISQTEPHSDRITYWLADTARRAVRQITDEPDASAPIFPRDGSCLYYSAGRRVKRISLESFERQTLFDMPAAVGTPFGIDTLSYDMTRCLTVTQPRAGVWAVAVLDLEQQTGHIVYERTGAPVGHLQYVRNRGRRFLVQVNDGYRADADGNCLRLIGPRGATLHVLHDDGSGHARLPVGFTLTERVQGHQCWVGPHNTVITTLHRRSRRSAPWVQDRIVTVDVDSGERRTVGEGQGFTHIHTTADGAYWVADCNRTADIFVGAVATGRYRRFCRSGATFGGAQYTHPHPFFLAGDRMIGWNSDETGVPHVYVATIPDGFLESL